MCTMFTGGSATGENWCDSDLTFMTDNMNPLGWSRLIHYVGRTSGQRRFHRSVARNAKATRIRRCAWPGWSLAETVDEAAVEDRKQRALAVPRQVAVLERNVERSRHAPSVAARPPRVETLIWWAVLFSGRRSRRLRPVTARAPRLPWLPTNMTNFPPLDGTDILALRNGHEPAHVHVIEHALAQRADGLLAHWGLLS
jgi:hypothetical protein